jgi:hypothetical protein
MKILKLLALWVVEETQLLLKMQEWYRYHGSHKKVKNHLIPHDNNRPSIFKVAVFSQGFYLKRKNYLKCISTPQRY